MFHDSCLDDGLGRSGRGLFELGMLCCLGILPEGLTETTKCLTLPEGSPELIRSCEARSQLCLTENSGGRELLDCVCFSGW
jgi:hypothetical protein